MNPFKWWGNFRYWWSTEVMGGMRWRAPHHCSLPEGQRCSTDDRNVKYIPEIWASDTAAHMTYMAKLMILIVPAYPHKWGSRGWSPTKKVRRWWHRGHCGPCKRALADWPKEKERLWGVPKPRWTAPMNIDQARAWVEKEIGAEPTIEFSTMEEAKRAADTGLDVLFYDDDEVLFKPRGFR